MKAHTQMKYRKKQLAGLLLVLAVSASGTDAQTLELSWGSSILREKMILEDGTALDPSSLVAAVGTFGSFVPTVGNFDQWMANWRVFDAITAPDTDPNGSDFFLADSGDARMARFAGSAHLLSGQYSDSEDAAMWNPTATFGGGEQGYVMMHTGDAYTVRQWLLFTSAVDSDGTGLADSVWQYPTLTGGQPQFAMAWWLDQADTAIMGAIHGGSGYGGSTGGGRYSDTSSDFVLRLHSDPAQVPEPGLALLLLLALIPLSRRKRPTPNRPSL